ncbi:ATP-NAD kinase-like domain-containing protein [Fomitopsis serialis]|uniref:ATP-NAD kinase-like domain-containing protein n=1 Tax=Fomitopsis serialis TaxID=139415 RepID=UPI002007BBE8|nr:ATP-NAD kinase-like domain-containing protein [Neoantrodia serialis]KAH9926180.1 ATP-NAD kinase-like domain-containing protein [Neoantrodia serialis]
MCFPCGKRSASPPPLPLSRPTHSDANTLIIGAQGRSTAVTLTGDSLLVQRNSDKRWPRVESNVHHVLWAELKGGLFNLSFLARRNAKSPLALVHVSGSVRMDEVEHAALFATRLMDKAYAGVKRHKKLKILINPKSGPGNAIAHFNERIEPVFHAARCIVDSTFTSYGGHARELMRELDLDQYDAVVVVSGDGSIHEVINGFAEHRDPERAFRIPIAPVPSGSGNGLSLNILGMQDGYDVSAGALNAIKGRPMHIDLMSVAQNGHRTFSFLSQTVGLFADLDLGTEWMRCLGATRFVLGYIFGVLRKTRCPVQLSLKVVESDKRKMVQDLNAYRANAKAQYSQHSSLPPSSPAPTPWTATTGYESTIGGTTVNSTTPLEPKRPSVVSEPDADGWVTFMKPLSFVYAGKGSYVSKDLMQFPVSIPDDGLLDVVAQELSTRKVMIDAMAGSESGDQFWMDTQHYFRATAYRVEPYKANGCFSVDGESYPFASFEVECHRGLATVLSPCGYYQAEFHLPEDAPRK